MEITEINEFKKNKVKVSLDNGIAFVLYKGDLSKYGINVGEIGDNEIEELFDEVLKKRALNRSLGIISSRDMTESMIRNKLLEDGYPECVIDCVIERLKSERLINDERFIRGFIECKSEKKSKNDIFRDLSSKGVDMDLVEQIYIELKEQEALKDESELIKSILEKKHFDSENASFEDCQKMIQYLLRKGFSFDSIRSAIKD